MALTEVDGHVARDGVDPAGEFSAVAQQPHPPIRADESLLRGFLCERGITEPAPRDAIHAAFVTFNEFAVALGITNSHGGHGGFVLLRSAGHIGWHI
jgi:hypothetical protein